MITLLLILQAISDKYDEYEFRKYLRFCKKYGVKYR